MLFPFTHLDCRPHPEAESFKIVETRPHLYELYSTGPDWDLGYDVFQNSLVLAWQEPLTS